MHKKTGGMNLGCGPFLLRIIGPDNFQLRRIRPENAYHLAAGFGGMHSEEAERIGVLGAHDRVDVLRFGGDGFGYGRGRGLGHDKAHTLSSLGAK